MGAYIKTQSLPRVEDPLTQRALSIIEEELERIARMGAGTILWGDGLQYVPGTRVASIDYNTTNFKITSGELNTIQDIDTGAEVQFAKASLITEHSANYTGLHPYTALLLENNDDIYIQLQGITTGHAGIAFADDDYNPPAGRIHYSFNDDVMDWAVATNVKMTLDADGLLTVVSLALNAHNADSYLAFKEDDSLKWTVGFDYDDDLKFKISEGIPGTNDVVEIQPGQGSLRFVRASVDKGLQYLDTGDSSRWMMRVASGTDVVEILNRAAHGKVEIHANTVTAGVDGDTLVATFEDDLITLAVDMSGTDLTLSNPVNIYALSHDSFAGFVADEHIDHSGVSISAGGILSGGGTIAANRTISLAHGDVDHDQTTNTHNLTTDIDHDALTNYEANQHFLQSAITELGTIATGVWQGTAIADAYVASAAAWNAKAASGANADITSMSGITGTITFGGATTENIIAIPDNLADALSVKEAGNFYQTFITTDGSEAIQFYENVGIGTAGAGYIGKQLTISRLADGAEIWLERYDATCLEDDLLGSIMFDSSDRRSTVDANVMIEGYAATDQSTAVKGGYLVFKTKAIHTAEAGAAVERMRITDIGNVGIGQTTFGANATRTSAWGTGVAPTTSPADCFQMYSADIVAGEAAPHFRTEHGDIIKLYQQALIADPAGQANDLDSEARTAIDAILDILENNGLMANA